MHDPYNLDRFIDAQASTYEVALEELRAGEKRSHWMWFIFPQLKALGRSMTAKHYGIGSFGEAEAYLHHGVLGPRLQTCVLATLEVSTPSLLAYLGAPDNLKFQSSLTLFSVVASAQGNVFQLALDKWCNGRADRKTLELLEERVPAATL